MTRATTIASLLSWLDGPDVEPLYRRLCGTAVRALDGARRGKERDDVAWLVEHANELAERLVTAQEPVSRATATTYASRVRGVGTSFLERLEATATGQNNSADTDRSSRRGASRDRLPQVLSRVASPATPDEEIAEAMAVITRWPNLIAEFIPALARAVERLGVGKSNANG